MSESLLWDLQRRFYATRGAEFWGSGRIPTYVTNNSWIARAVARLVVHLLLDLGREDRDRMVTILEVGAGSGQLGFLLLTELFDLTEHCPEGLPPFRYVLSDVSESTLSTWSSHPRFTDWLADGRLDLAHYDLNDPDATLELRHAGERIDANHRTGPLVVLANYVLDSLAQDAFRVRAGRIEEGRVSLMADHPHADASDPATLTELAALFGWRPLPSGPFYEDLALESLLNSYLDLLTDGAFSLPLGAIRAMNQLANLSEGGLFVLSNDKGWSHSSQQEGHTAPNLVSHGSVSLMVDHHALGRWCVEQQGGYLMSSPREGAVETALFNIGSTADMRLTRLAFDCELEATSPADFLGLSLAMQAAEAPDIRRILSLLRQGAWDPGWLVHLIDAVETAAPDAPTHTVVELRRALDQVGRRTFWIPGRPQHAEAALARAYAALPRDDG